MDYQIIDRYKQGPEISYDVLIVSVTMIFIQIHYANFKNTKQTKE